ncbi:MAG: sulfatase-like hydrolase/transferase [Planctomycetota bacterium]|jgi:choline-sulfatase|nr:sulfatase-like hydrolase/transferase [Planctomycetota bacterium]
MPKPANLLFICSDQHSRDMSGCYGNPVIQTPHIDTLAARGTRFTNAVTNCPICVPARASLATGKYVHQIGYWDNAFPYEGRVRGWGHQLIEQGYQVDSIGKLHYRSVDDDQGFVNEIEGLYVVDGIGDIEGSLREEAPFRHKRSGVIEAGPGNSTYLEYDLRNEQNGRKWLQEHANDDKPWMLFLSFVCPHPPFISPPDWFDRYPLEDIPLPPQWRHEDWPDHPVMNYFRDFFDHATPFSEEEVRRMNAAYFGVTSFLDERIGEVLQTLDESGLADSTRVIYTSDHGESRGARGRFGKLSMYSESVGIPFIMAGPDIPVGTVSDTPISLVDCGPTILDAVGAEEPESELPGESLFSLIESRDRYVFSEYHSVGSKNGFYMLRNRQHKYVHYVGAPPQLFDLAADPHEMHNLAQKPEHKTLLNQLERELRTLLDPEAVNETAQRDQRAIVESFGGRAPIFARGAFDNSPVPGEAPRFKQNG